MPNTHRWEDLLPEEFYEEFNRAPIVYWACGSMEEHGLHNALGTDPYTAYDICLRAVCLSGGIVFPPVPFAPAYFPGLTREQLRAKEKELFPPSLWVSRELCERIYVELMESCADLGFRACLAVGGHAPADALLQDLEKRLNGRIGNMRFWGGGTGRLLRDAIKDLTREQPLAGSHGGMWETSLVMAMRRDWVDLPRAKRIPKASLTSQLDKLKPEAIAYIARANAELGNRMLDEAAQRLAQIARDLLTAK